MTRILVVEDERELATLIRNQLVSAGYDVEVTGNGLDAVNLAGTVRPDLIILDWMLPGLDGLEVCRRIRATSITPILMLTARAQELDRVLGLEVGADDYLTKPFSMPELLARTRALLRRVEFMQRSVPSPITSSEQNERIRLGELQRDLAGRTVEVAGEPVDLTPKEFELLALLAEQPGRAYSRQYLLQRVWGDEYIGFDRTVDTHVVRLRKKLGPVGERVATVWGVGYKLRSE